MTAARSGGWLSRDDVRLTRGALTDDTRVAWIAGRLGSSMVIALTAALVLAPVSYVFSRALTNEADGIRRLFDDPNFPKALTTTIYLAVGSSVIAVVLGTALAWWAHGLTGKSKWLGLLPLAPLVIPQVALLVGFMFLYNPTIGYMNQLLRTIPGFRGRDNGPINIYSLRWIIALTGLALSAFVYLFVRTSLSKLHEELIYAAAASGAGPTRIFWRIVLPLLRPAITNGAIVVLLLALGQFAAALFLGPQAGVRVLTTEMYRRMSTSPPDFALASAYGMPILIVGLVFLIVQRYLLRDQERYVITGGKGMRPHSRRTLLPKLALIAYGLLTIALPVAVLVIVSLQKFWSKDIDPGTMTFENYRAVARQPDLTAAIRNSLTYAVVASLATLPLGYIVARTTYHRARRPITAALQEMIASLPLGIPSVIFGAGFLFTFTESPIRLYGKPAAIIVVYVTILLPFVSRLQLAAMTSIGDDLGDAASASGAGVLTRFFRVELPLLRPALGASAALAVVLATHEFSASVLVRSQTTPIMGPIMFDLWSFASYPMTAVMALIMCLVTGVGILLAMLLAGGRTWQSRV